MVSLDVVRRLALALPEASEQDHHGMASFRIDGKVFATVPDPDHVRIMVDEEEVRACVAEDPDTYAELYWGRRLACVVVHLESASTERVRELLGEAWLRKAPRALARTFVAAGLPAPPPASRPGAAGQRRAHGSPER